MKNLPLTPADPAQIPLNSPAQPAALQRFLQQHMGLVILLQVALAAFFLLYGLAAYPLNDNNEGLYAEIAREMFQTGDYIIPHLNGLPYIEKPPLLYWLMAGSEALFGNTAFAARLVPAFSMFALNLYCVYFGRRIGNVRLGMLASLILSSSLAVSFLSRTVIFDPLLTALMSMALLNFYLWYVEHRQVFLRVAYVLLGLAVLTKGAIAIVLCGTITVLFLLLDARRKSLLRQLFDPWGLALFLAVTVPWHIAAARALPEFSWFYFINEHVLRFLGKREPHDYYTGPVYYYVPRVLLLLFPWTPFLLLLSQRRQGATQAVPAGAPQRLERLCLVWFLVTFIFFSVSTAKANYYLIVAAPALALWLASVIDAHVRTERLRPLFYCGSAIFLMYLGLAATLLLPSALARLHARGMPVYLDLELVLGLIAMLAFSAVALVYIRSRRPDAAMALFALTAAPALIFTLSVMHSRKDEISCAAMARLISHAAPGDVRVYTYKDYEDVFSTLRFYLPRPLYLIDSTSADLAFGCRLAGNHGPCQDMGQFIAYSQKQPVVVVVKDNRLAEFRQRAGEDGLVSIGRFGDRVVLARPLLARDGQAGRR